MNMENYKNTVDNTKKNILMNACLGANWSSLSFEVLYLVSPFKNAYFKT